MNDLNNYRFENYRGPRQLECYMKKKRQKKRSLLTEKTSYKFYKIDLEIGKFFIKKNKESKIFSKEFDIDAIYSFKRELDKDDLNICDFKFGFQFFIDANKYVLYQKDERDYYDWIRLLEFHFNKKDIGTFDEYKANQRKILLLKEKMRDAERSKSVINTERNLNFNNKNNENNENNFNNSILNTFSDKNKNNYRASIQNTNDLKNKRDISETRVKNNKIRATMVTDKIINENDLNQMNKRLLVNNIINDMGWTYENVDDCNYNNKEESSGNKIHIKLTSDNKKEHKIAEKIEKNYYKANDKDNSLLEINKEFFKMNVEPVNTNQTNNNKNIYINNIENKSSNHNVHNNKSINFKEAPMTSTLTKLGPNPHNFGYLENNKNRSSTPTPIHYRHNSDVLYKNHENYNNKFYEEQNALENEDSRVFQRINEIYKEHDDLYDFPDIEDFINQNSNNQKNYNQKKITKESLINQIHENNQKKLLNSINQKEKENNLKLNSKSPIPQRKVNFNDSVLKEINQSFFKEAPIKKDIEREKFLLENLHYGIDNYNLNKFENDLNVTIGGIPINKINKVNFTEKIREEEPKKIINKRRPKYVDDVLDLKQIVCDNGNVINVKKTIVPGEDENSWTLNLSVIQEKKKKI